MNLSPIFTAVRTFKNDDTIVALATGGGIAAIAVIRLSGKESFTVAEKIFFPAKGKKKQVSDYKTHTLHFGSIKENDLLIDEVLLSVMKGPKSFTGEDTIEISCHGSTFVQQKILELCLSNGARPADPGEFTLRAFLNGKMDLTQAEAVADLIAADSAGAHSLAMKQMRGGFSEEIKKLRNELIHFASLIELELDFAEEDVEFANRGHLRETIDNILRVIEKLIRSFEFGNVIRKGIPVVIAGRPNAGKSTLLNALLNENRAIVSETEGTTRDTIEEEITLEGVKFRFIDTAGLRETHDAIEKIGVSKTFEKMNESPVILYIFDVIGTTGSQLYAELEKLKSSVTPGVRIIPVGNKIDAVSIYNVEQTYNIIKNPIFISAKDKTNIDQLRNLLLSLYSHGKIEANNSIVTSARHVDALKHTAECLQRVYNGLLGNLTNDFIAADLRHAMNYLGEITGEISTDDLLENIFSKFCIGK